MAITYRILTASERKLLESEIKLWINQNDLELILQKYQFIAGEGRWVEIFITNHETLNLLTENEQIKPYSVGMGFGEIKDNDILLSLGGANLLAPLTTRKIVISPDAEQLFLYQRNIFCKSILEYPITLQTKDKILVMNTENECLGIGKLLLPIEDVKKKENSNKEAIQNLMDLGWYLRKGK